MLLMPSDHSHSFLLASPCLVHQMQSSPLPGNPGFCKKFSIDRTLITVRETRGPTKPELCLHSFLWKACIRKRGRGGGSKEKEGRDRQRDKRKTNREKKERQEDGTAREATETLRIHTTTQEGS